MTVFNSLYADSYDELYTTKNYGQECDLVEASLSRFGAKPATILDIGCGTGGHSIELARRGYQVTGVDMSPHMIDHATAKSAALSADRRPAWLVGDARTFDAPDGPFDAAIMMFAVIGYLTTNDDVLQGMINIRKHLKPGALFLSDFWYGPSVLSDRPTDRVRVLERPDGQVIRATNTTLAIAQHTADVSFRLWSIKNGVASPEERETHHLRYYFPQEYGLFLAQAGFRMENISAFPSLDTPLSDQSWYAFAVARAV